MQVTVVMKFGGSSVANAERMREVAAIVCSFPDELPCVVLSAMGKVCATAFTSTPLVQVMWEHRLPFLHTPACRDWQPCHRCLLGEHSTVSPTIQQGDIIHTKINLSAVLDWECWLRPEPDGCLCAGGRRPICCCKRARKQ